MPRNVGTAKSVEAPTPKNNNSISHLRKEKRLAGIKSLLIDRGNILARAYKLGLAEVSVSLDSKWLAKSDVTEQVRFINVTFGLAA